MKLADIADVQTGIAKGKKNIADPVSRPYLRVANVQDGHLDLSEIKTIEVSRHEIDRFSLKVGDVLFTEGGDCDKLGRGTVWQGEVPSCLHQNHIFAVRMKNGDMLPYFLATFAASTWGRTYFLSCSKQTTNLASINSTQLKKMPLPVPPLPEQRKIAAILSTWDRAIELIRKLIAAKQKRKQALMQQLLTGKVRFREFSKSQESIPTRYCEYPKDWKHVRLEKVASEVSERNADGKEHQVLSCTKYDGLVDSLTYFGKRIFSDNLSTYKIVRRNHFAYATNHIEEGSIGYQNVCDVALISPMYTVFKTEGGIDDGFLYKLLKSDLYIHIYQANTSASVDRRGSLRWTAFSHIRIPLPSLAEQRAIAAVLNTQQQEIDVLCRKREALKLQKKGLMQQLLTGKTRVTISNTGV